MGNENQLLIPPSMYQYVPPMVRDELAKMSAQKQNVFLYEYSRKEKSVGNAYLFWFFLLGSHYGYLGIWRMQVLFWLTCFGAGFWWIIDAFRIPSIVAEYNRDIAVEVLRDLKAIS